MANWEVERWIELAAKKGDTTSVSRDPDVPSQHSIPSIHI
jgi:hypothetical protein